MAPTPAATLALPRPIEPFLRRAVVLVVARDHARVPAKELLRARRLVEDEVVTKGSDVVDLLLDPGAGELVIDRQAVSLGAVDARRVPDGRVEEHHAPGRAFES